jgi:arsenate reductase
MSEVVRQRVLILCTGNSCRSQMAEGWINHLYGDRVEAFSAGHLPASAVHPMTLQVMREVGIDVSSAHPKHMNEFLDQSFDTVITVCDPAKQVCPVFPGKMERIHRTFDDPVDARGTDDERRAEFRRVRDEIQKWIVELFGE